MHSRRNKGLLIAAAIIGGIAFILLAANIDPIDRHCPWQFPKIASCLLSARGTLVSGLVAAGGALFAAWAAWTAVRDQIKFEMDRDAARRAESERARKKIAEIELVGLRLTLEHIEKIISNFKDLGAASEWSYVDNLRSLSKSGGLAFFSQPLPPPFPGSVGHLATKLNQLATRIDEVENDPRLRDVSAPSGITSQLRSALIAIDRAAKETVDEYIGLRDQLISAIREREVTVGTS